MRAIRGKGVNGRDNMPQSLMMNNENRKFNVEVGAETSWMIRLIAAVGTSLDGVRNPRPMGGVMGTVYAGPE